MIRISVRIPNILSEAIKYYIEKNPGMVKESEAVRRLLQKGLEAEGIKII